MYQDMYKEPMEEVKWLSCFSSPPKMVNHWIAIGGVELQGMCCVEHPASQGTSVIVSSFRDGVVAYEAASNVRDWKQIGKLPGVEKGDAGLWDHY